MALELVKIMKNLASQGISIVCTIHQPSTQIFEQFGTLCLLSEGRVAYFGRREDTVGYFAKYYFKLIFIFFKKRINNFIISNSLGFQCPLTYNPSDFYIKTLAIMPNSREESLKRAKKVCDSFEQSKFYVSLSDEIAEIENSPVLDSNVDTKKKHKYFIIIYQVIITFLFIKYVKFFRYDSTWFAQVKWLTWRNFINDNRNFVSRMLLIQTIVIY